MSLKRIELDVSFTKKGNEYISDVGTVRVLGNGRIMMHKEEIGQLVSATDNGDGTWHVVANIYESVIVDYE